MPTNTDIASNLQSSSNQTNWLGTFLALSLRQRWLTLILAVGLLIWGTLTIKDMPVDVLPDLTAPTVAVMTEAHGLTSTEVERLITLPLESTLNGSAGIRRLRSSSMAGFSIVWVEFNWGTEIYRARQIVNEKLQLAVAQFPEQADRPVLAPITSIMGEIMFVALRSNKHSTIQIRTAADRQIRRRLLAIPGVSQVIPIGGRLKQYQVLLRPRKLQAYKINPESVISVIKKSNANHAGGWFVTQNREYAIEGLGRIRNKQELEQLTIRSHKGIPVLLKHIAVVRVGKVFHRGVGSYNAKPAVIIGIQKQPSANTLTLTQKIDATLSSIQRTLPSGMTIDRKGFRQADFIKSAIGNVQQAMIEGAVLVVIILFFFLLNVPCTLISALAIPLSVITALLTLKLFGATINTMTLGGITVAIGALVDDAVINVENIFRRLRLNTTLPPEEQKSGLSVVFEASLEILNSILFATLILMLVFLPLFFLSGMEGRLLKPLGIAYLVAIFASLIVALTITPVLSYFLLAKRSQTLQEHESFLVRMLKLVYEPTLQWCLQRPKRVLFIVLGFTLGAFIILPFLGRSFLPPFNEGSLTLSVTTIPGTSLRKSSQLGLLVEKKLLLLPEVISTTRRTGRAELDEHAQGVYAAEIDVNLQMKERSMDALLKNLRKTLASVPGIVVNIGQPISHRIDHMLSGTRAAIAIKLFGPELPQLQSFGERIRSVVSKIPGTADVAMEPLVQIPRFQLIARQTAIARYGLNASDLMEMVELALWGEVPTHILEGQRLVPVRVRYDYPQVSAKELLANLPLVMPSGVAVPLQQMARIHYGWGPNRINRESGQRRIIISVNSTQTDLIGLVKKIQARVHKIELPPGYYIEYGGQFEREAAARTILLWLGLLVLLGTFVLLRLAFHSTRAAVLILINVPLALIGGVFSIALAGQVLSIASIVGLIALFGIATRNGIIMISHYQHLQIKEKEPLYQAVVRGSMERLSPILMTALTTGLGMIPLLIASGKPGNELQSPMALVILGGIVSATLLNLLVLPILYHKLFATNETSNTEGAA